LFLHNRYHVFFSFCKCERLHTNKDFKKIFEDGDIFENESMKIIIYNRNDSYIVRRFGVIVKKKIGIAVDRNKIKRKLREIFRLNKHMFKPGIDLIFVPKFLSLSLQYLELEKSVLTLIYEAGYFIRIW
jgi:ribonuclease P protein component